MLQNNRARPIPALRDLDRYRFITRHPARSFLVGINGGFHPLRDPALPGFRRFEPRTLSYFFLVASIRLRSSIQVVPPS